jgi:hypothetical protein
MATRKREVCGIVYRGTSFPQFRGTRCQRPVGHDKAPPHGAARHLAMVNGIPLQWFTAQQKAKRANEKKKAGAP